MFGANGACVSGRQAIENSLRLGVRHRGLVPHHSERAAGHGEGLPCGHLARRPINPTPDQHAAGAPAMGSPTLRLRPRLGPTHPCMIRSPLTAEFGIVRSHSPGARVRRGRARCERPVDDQWMWQSRRSSTGSSFRLTTASEQRRARRENTLQTAVPDASTAVRSDGDRASSVPAAPRPSASPSAPQRESPAASGSWQCPEIRDQH